MPTTTTTPRVEARPTQPTLGIRVRTPMKGMAQTVRTLENELFNWLDAHGIEATGPRLLRYHIIDMRGAMDIESCVPVATHHPGDGRVTPGELPAGRYAYLVYRGAGVAGNKVLVDWIKSNGSEWDAWDDPAGHAFACRYETYLTDPAVEPRKTRWDIEVAIRLIDGAALGH